MSEETLILDIDSIYSAVEVNYDGSPATFFLNSYGTFQLFYKVSLLTILDNVSDFSVLYFSGDNPYFVIYALQGNVISRYLFYIHIDGSFSLNFDFDIASNATTLDLYNVSVDMHGLSYIDTDLQLNYVKFVGDVGIQYYWDKDDDRSSNQIEVDDGITVGVYFIDVTDNVSVEDLAFPESSISVTPVMGINVGDELIIDISDAIIDTETMHLYINDFEVTNYTVVGTDITFNAGLINVGHNELQINDGMFSYFTSFYANSPDVKRPVRRIDKIGRTSGSSNRRSGAIINGFGAPGTRIPILIDNS